MRSFRKVLLTISIVSLITGILIFLFTGGMNHNVLPLISMGEKYLGEEQYEDAELAFSRAINIDPKSARAYYGQARASIGIGDDRTGIDLLNTVAAIAPDKKAKTDWMISKIESGEGGDILLLPYKTDVTSDAEFESINITSDDREIVVTLDTSGSMDGTPIEATKMAAKSFVHEILQQYAGVGVVTFSDGAEILSDFTMDEQALDKSLDGLYAGGGTATASGLTQAYDMLNRSGARNRIIVLMSDGEAGDDPIPVSQEIKDSGITLYTLGFFGSVSNKAYVQSLMETMASDGCHYEVDSEEDMQNFFADIANQINGQKYYYIRIACPVDVSVRYDGEKLESKGAESAQRTSFGTLTFEESDGEEENSATDKEGIDDRIKVLRLKEGAYYEISIEGNGRGRMNYTIGFMNDNGEYSDVREFKSIPVTRDTEILTEAADTSTTTLNVDTDGDGRFDTKYVARQNGKGEKVDNTRYIMIGGVAAAALIILIVILCIVKHFRRRKNGA